MWSVGNDLTQDHRAGGDGLLGVADGVFEGFQGAFETLRGGGVEGE